MSDESSLFHEDKAGTLFLKEIPETLNEVGKMEGFVNEHFPKKVLGNSKYLQILLLNWRNKLLNYPIAFNPRHPWVYLIGFSQELPFAFVEELIQLYNEVQSACTRRIIDFEIPILCHFVTKDIVVFEYSYENDSLGMLENEVLFNREMIYKEEMEKGIRFISKHSGYFIYGKKGLDIIRPIINDKNPYSLKMRILPTLGGDEKLKSFGKDFLIDHQKKYPDSPIPTINIENINLREKGIFRYWEFDILKGRPPKEGKDGSFSLNELTQKPVEDEKGSIDFHSFNCIRIVRAGEELGKKILPILGKDGLDIYGNIHEVKKGKDKIIRVDSNILVERKETEFLYIARITGIVQFKKDMISLNEMLVVEGDVDYSTGNIDYEKNVYIKGYIRSGFTVTSKGNIIIEGGIDEGTIINCEGDVQIKKGIIGEKTTLTVMGNLTCAFIERSTVYCQGSILVNKSILGAHIYCLQNLTVKGMGLQGKKIGILSGSECYIYQGIYSLSLGAPNNKTEIYLGFDYSVSQKMNDIGLAINVLRRRQGQIVEKLPPELSTPEGRKKVSSFSPEKKQEITKNLMEMKQIIGDIEKLEEKKRHLEDQLYNDNVSDLSLDFREGIKGPITLSYQLINKNFPPHHGPGSIKYNRANENLELV